MTSPNRQLGLMLLGLLTIGSFLISIVEMLSQTPLATIAISWSATLIMIALCVIYWREWRYAPYVIVVIATLLTGLGLQEPHITYRFSVTVFLPPILALILTNPLWVLGSALAIILGLLARAGWYGAYADPVSLLAYVMVIGGVTLARMATDRAYRLAEESARRAEEALQQMEQQSKKLAYANEQLQGQIDQQRQLLDLVAVLETPVVPLAEGVLLAPVVGHIDSRRAEVLTTKLLEEAHAQSARLIVLDIAGVAMIDSVVARALLNTAHALQLLGCRVTISGISANVAISLIDLNIELGDILTVRSPQEALSQYLKAMPLRKSTDAPPPLVNGITGYLASNERARTRIIQTN